MAPHAVARETLNALGKGPRVVPGVLNRFFRRTVRTAAAAADCHSTHGHEYERPDVTDFLAGFFAPWLGYAAISGLHLVLPARRVAGYAHDEKSGAPLRYRLNGPLVFAVNISLWLQRRDAVGLVLAASLVWRYGCVCAKSCDYRRCRALGTGQETRAAVGSLSRSTRQSADVQRACRREDAPLPSWRDLPLTQPALVRGASLPLLPR